MTTRASFVILVLLLGAQCAARSSENAGRTAAAAKTEPPVSAPTTESADGQVRPPPAFEGVDFANFSYPAVAGWQGARLRGGELERPAPEGGGDWFRLVGVRYVDLTGDGQQEAFVSLSAVVCGGSCDGGAYQFYVYESGRRKPALFWRALTGSRGYGCGLKSLNVRGRSLAVEVFRDCRFDGESFSNTSDEFDPNKFSSGKAFTRFDFEVAGRRVVLRKREVFPYPHDSVMNYQPEMSFSDE